MAKNQTLEGESRRLERSTWKIVALVRLPVDPLLPPVLLVGQAPGLALVHARVADVAVQGGEVFALPGLLVKPEPTLLTAAHVA